MANDDFSKNNILGLSFDQFLDLTYARFGAPNCPLKIIADKDETFLECPLFRQVRRIVEICAGDNPPKLTSIGNLPKAMVQEIYSLGVKEWRVEDFYKSLNSEDKSEHVQIAHAICASLGLVRKYKGLLKATKAGKEMLKETRTFFMEFLRAICTSFEPAFLDGYNIELNVNFGSANMIALFLKNGDTYKSEDVFAEEYCHIMNLDTVARAYGYDPASICRAAACRVIMRTLVPMGLIEKRIKANGSPYYLYDESFKASEVMKKIFKFDTEEESPTSRIEEQEKNNEIDDTLGKFFLDRASDSSIKS